MWKKFISVWENDTGRLSWGRVGSFLCIVALVFFTLLVWKYGKVPEMHTFVEFAKDITTKLAALAGSLYGASKINDAFGKPGQLTDTPKDPPV